MRRSSLTRELVAHRFPLIIVDEAQDTWPEAWECIKTLAPFVQVICLADLDQQIFDHLPGIGPERVAEIEATLQPLCVDLGSAQAPSHPKGGFVQTKEERKRTLATTSVLAALPYRLKNTELLADDFGIAFHDEGLAARPLGRRNRQLGEVRLGYKVLWQVDSKASQK